MKRKLLFLILLLGVFGFTSFAQNISVKSFRALPNDMTASSLEGKRIDRNNEVAALIKIATTQTGFTFEAGALGIVDTKQDVGEVWVWVPRDSRKITIKHPQLGILRDYRYPVEIQAERTYEMELIVGKVETIVTQSFTSQFLVFNVSPKDAMLIVDGEPWPLTDGTAQKMVDFGKHDYLVEATDYHSEAGRITVDDPDNPVVVEVPLKPAFGYLKITGDQAILSQATIYIDNGNSPDALKSSKQLKSGQHKVHIIHPKYKPYERMVTITDDETTTLSVNMDANFSTVTLKVDADAEIYVNNERKGVRTWAGDLEAGTYIIETRMKGHRTITDQKVITESMTGEVIELGVPIPINGTLMVSSTPSMAKLYIDGKEVGETPKRINSILIGEHTVRIEKQGCAPVNRTVTIEEGKTYTMDEKLDTGRNVTIKTDREGDKIYVDGEYVGETPRVTPLGFGKHSIRVTRDKAKSEKEIEITTTSTDSEVFMEFGRLVKITTDQPGDVIKIDGEEVGTSPLSIDLAFGAHTLYAKRDKKYADKDIEVKRIGGETEHHLVLHSESATHFVKRGVNFITVDAAASLAPQLSYGLTFGSVKRVGWFLTAASNFSFDALNYSNTAYSDGFVGAYYYGYTGESCSTRISVMGGFLVRVAGPVYFRLGAGVGTRVKGWYTNNGEIVKMGPNSFTGVDAMSGLQVNLKGLSLSADAVTTNFKTLEVKLGVGFCWKKK